MAKKISAKTKKKSIVINIQIAGESLKQLVSRVIDELNLIKE